MAITIWKALTSRIRHLGLYSRVTCRFSAQFVLGGPAPSMEIEESASGGSTSTTALECRWSATDDDGFRSSRLIVLKMRT